MASNDGSATFRISIDGNASVASKDIAGSARLASQAIAKYEDEVKSLSSDLRRLRGNSDEVTEAKAALKKRIDEARQSVSTLTTALTKQGVSYKAAADAAKKYGTSAGKLPNLRKAASKAVEGVGGPIAKAAFAPLGKKLGEALAPAAKRAGAALQPLTGRLAKFGGGAKKVLGAIKEDAGSVLPSLGTAMEVVGVGAELAVAAVAAVGVAAAAAGAGLIAFGLSSADASAKMARQREALLGNADDAKRFGDQISVLAGKVPQGTAELNALAVSLSKTRLSGKDMVTTMQAVAQASGAVDEAAGAKVQELITRGQNTGRFQLTQFRNADLQGTGIDFEDVAKEYAAGAHKSVEAARKELVMGQVPLSQGAEALARVTEKKFGDINLKNAFSLENGPKKFFEALKTLSSDIDLGPITKGLQESFGQLSPDAPLGSAVKAFMSSVGQDFVDIAGRSIPLLLEGFKWLVVGALKVGTYFYEMRNKIREAFSADGWVGVGKQIVMGLVDGILGANAFLATAIKSLAGSVKGAFTDSLGIHSDSKVFAQYGQNTVGGYATGVEKAQSRADTAVSDMVSTPSSMQAGGGGDTHETIEVHLHGVPMNNVDAMKSPDFLAQLTRAIRDARTAKGVGFSSSLVAVP